jgi:nitrous oxidase accessory protein NosD
MRSRHPYRSGFTRAAAALSAAVALPLALTAAVAAGSGPGSDTRSVAAGQSIQAAIDRASPGDTIVVGPGVYHENLTIEKSGITLRGAGASPEGTVLEPPATPRPSICTEFGEVNGICVTGYVDPETREPGARIEEVTVTGFLVRHFSRFGILLYNADDLVVARNEVSHSRRYGISGYDLEGVRYLDNIVHDNTGGGLQLADSARANAVMAGNRVYANSGEGGIGIFLRDTSTGVLSANRVEDNCVGIAVVAIDSATPTRHWVIRGNTVRDNTRACPPAEEGGPPLSGIGVMVLGADETVVESNAVGGNHPAGETPFAGGVAVVSSADLGGSDADGNLVRANRVSGNAPADVIHDGSGAGNRFLGNTCGTSVPDGLCH